MANISKRIFLKNGCSLPILHDSGDIPQPLHHGHGAAVCRPAQYTNINTDSTQVSVSRINESEGKGQDFGVNILENSG